NIELEVPYQINRLSDCFKNNLIDYSTLVDHLNRLIGTEKAKYYLNVIKESPEIPQLSKEFNLETILKRTDELLNEYNKINSQIISQEQLIENYHKNKSNPENHHCNESYINNYTSNHINNTVNKNKNNNNLNNNNNNNNNQDLKKCNCKELFGKDIFPFDLMEFLSKHGDHSLTDYCTESCIYLIVKKYQDVIEYANNKIFFLRALKPMSPSGYFKSADNVGFIEFNQYMENLLHPISPMHKKVEDAIKFKIHNKKLTVNKDSVQNIPYGFWLHNNNILYEITKDTPIK
ncbi:hypothetical protein DICPUDRAFT_32479, partial [Dictyostelium purpureum]